MPLDLAEQSSREQLQTTFISCRKTSLALATRFPVEDWMLQSMPDASPIKWHLAHTSWFYEAFVLEKFKPDYTPFDPSFNFLFNSYYEQIGERHPRPARGMLSRPTAEQVVDYRAHIDRAVSALILDLPEAQFADLADLVQLGCVHEEQHQELLLTDIQHGLFQNPMRPAAFDRESLSGERGAETSETEVARSWRHFDGGLTEVGHKGAGFAFDNEGPHHKIYLAPFYLASHLSTIGDYADFIADGGYSTPTLWLSDGWARVQSENWCAPLYWRREEPGDNWTGFSLFGEAPLEKEAPVWGLSYYEAAAFAEWTGYRLPTEFEWEYASQCAPLTGQFLRGAGFSLPRAGEDVSSRDSGTIPADVHRRYTGLCGMFGSVWQWTASPYVAYPGFRTAAGAVGEYNGKFMSSQMVLRGGSSATPNGHIRRTYRNFFPPHARWQFAGLRLARDV
ncbi:MAG: ergothioneine biosynthesis protein EgtB [Pseudomonadota bacterium]